MEFSKEKLKKPEWIKIKLGNNDQFSFTGKIVNTARLNTICQSGKCPNLGECWNNGTATFMIGGDICTRSCRFCNTKTGKPMNLNPEEPFLIAESISNMKLSHAVITSVNRDDLPDFGASHWKKTISQVKKMNPGITIEVLIPDFNGEEKCLDEIISVKPDIVSHNIETVRRLTHDVRSIAKYDTSLSVLDYLSKSGMKVKSGLMLGLGETIDEVYTCLEDLLSVGCFLLSIGQYLQPSKSNISVKEYIHPDVFEAIKSEALRKGFKYVESAPLVRSSYHSKFFL